MAARPGNPGLSSQGAATHVRLPLWLLAFLCLAWPVTSFLLARRRRGRGFAVEPLSTPAAAGAESARR